MGKKWAIIKEVIKATDSFLMISQKEIDQIVEVLGTSKRYLTHKVSQEDLETIVIITLRTKYDIDKANAEVQLQAPVC